MQVDDPALAVTYWTGRCPPAVVAADTRGRPGATRTGYGAAEDRLARLERLFAWFRGLLVLVAIVALAYCIFVLADTSLYQSQETRQPHSDPNPIVLASGPLHHPALY